LHQQQPLTPARPPVPLFPNSTGHINLAAPAVPAAPMDFTSFDDTPFGAYDTALEAPDFHYSFTGSSAQTVSPKDLYSEMVGSAPPSTAFTNLTSPDMNSPYMADSYETSPMFQPETDLHSEAWYPLFQEAAADTKPAAPDMQRTISGVSTGQGSSSSASPPTLGHTRKVSSTASPMGGAGRQSSTAGVKSRRRKNPLPPIEIDPNDRLAAKRARNTLAARESRQRKLDHVSQLEQQIADLQGVNGAMKAELARLGYQGPLLE